MSTYGQEASTADRRAITALVKRYYEASASADGKTACALLYSTIAYAVPKDFGKSPPGPAYARGKSCPVVMMKMLKHDRHSAGLAATEVTGVRLNGDHGFATLRSKKIPKGSIYVEREGTTWKIGVLIGYGMEIHR